MENIEFISAKDLPTTESNEVDVLCVEKGELKRKEGASLGGGKAFFLRIEDAYHDSSADGGVVIFVNPELFAEIEGEVNGESVCSVRLIGEVDDGGMKFAECPLFEDIFLLPSGLSGAEIGFDSGMVTVAKTAEDADAIIASMNSGE